MSLSHERSLNPFHLEEEDEKVGETQSDTPTPGPGPEEDLVVADEEASHNTAEFCWGCRYQRPGQMEHACLGFGPFLIDEEEDCDC